MSDIWKDIDTAPKDGTILVFEDIEGEVMDEARWDNGEWNSVFGNMDVTMVRWRKAGI